MTMSTSFSCKYLFYFADIGVTVYTGWDWVYFSKKYIKFKLNLQPIVSCVSSGEKQCSVVKKIIIIEKDICFFIGCLRWRWFFLGRCQPPQIYNGTHTFRFQDSARNQEIFFFLNFAHDRKISNVWKHLKTLVFVYIFGMAHKWICFSRSCLHKPPLTLNAQSLWGLARSLRYKTWAAYASVHPWCTPCAYFEIKQTTKLFGYNSIQTVQFIYFIFF